MHLKYIRFDRCVTCNLNGIITVVRCKFYGYLYLYETLLFSNILVKIINNVVKAFLTLMHAYCLYMHEYDILEYHGA